MHILKRGLCLGLTMALSATMILPVHAVDPLSTSFTSFMIEAEQVDTPQTNLHVELYRRDEAGTFQPDGNVRYTCSINRATADAKFLIQPQADQVWVEVDYLTDANQDGIYEMQDGETAPVCDVMTTKGKLVDYSDVDIPWQDADTALKKGTTYTLTSAVLAQGGQQALTALGSSASPYDDILYYVTVRYLSPVDSEEYALGYYLQLHESFIMPDDVPESAWYYSAVKYALQNGLFSGTGPNTFSPNSVMTRAMLWTVLAKVDGQTLASGNPWYSAAQSWAIQAGVSDGTNPDGSITREQLALMLYKLAGAASTSTDALAAFKDGAKVSSWAQIAMAWAVDNGILSGRSGGILDPQGNATRAEVAAMLRQYVENVL